MKPRVDLHEFVTGFAAEADEHLAAGNAALLAIEAALQRGEASPREVRSLFRALHTIKGLSAMVGVEPISDLAHAMEAVLRNADRMGGRLPLAALEPLIAGMRAIDQRVRLLTQGETVAAAPARLLETLAHLPLAESAPHAELALDPEIADKLGASERELLLAGIGRGERALRVDFIPGPERASRGLNITSVRERVAQIAEIVKVIPLSVPRSEEAPGGLKFAMIVVSSRSNAELAEVAASSPERVLTVLSAAPLPLFDEQELGAEPGTSVGRVVRVDVARLDDAMERLSSLVVTRFRLQRTLAELARGGADVRELRLILDENSRQLREMRAALLRLRLVPAQQVLEPLRLVVRGVAQESHKSVELTLVTGRAELDKAVAERIFPAIVHLVRNAVDHGIESADERRARGKPERGNVRVVCEERGDAWLELSVEDDGRGIDATKLAERAGRPVPKTDAELLALLATPGLSSRDQVTKTSGRGLGVDIVSRVVSELGGELWVNSAPGAGTRFKLHLPQSVLIVEAFSFECSGQRFVVPVSSIEEIVEVEPSEVVATPARPGRAKVRLLERRGRAIPLVALEALLELPAAPARARKALIVRRRGEALAFEVDRMLGQQEVVVRPLDDRLVRVPGVSGATDLGDGQPTLVLDLAALEQRALHARREVAA